ncbi:hypothetical protein INR49_008975 [Caranx melampygus]|nr:hypothetical protein INR49_008975 [Caranx melampygus]
MMTMNGKQHFSVHPALHEHKYPGLHSGSEGMRRVCVPAPQGNIFGGFDESLLARAEALAAADSIVSHGKNHPFKPDHRAHLPRPLHHRLPPPPPPPRTDPGGRGPPGPPLHQPGRHRDGRSGASGDDHDGSPPPAPAPPPADHGQLHQAMASMAHPHSLSVHGGMACVNDVESDPRELEAFAERFKQRRIKLGVTQADVGSALANLKIPGVGSLSQSTICRFESLTLSHNNMIALKPEAEAAYREKSSKPDLFNGSERKRKRTSIAAPEKRSLEAYFAIQPRPSSEKIAAIAEKLDLKKNVVRVWFCNQRQKQKRMKYSAVH